MTDTHGTLQPVKNLLVKYFIYQTDVLMTADHTVVIDCNAAGLLSSVLQSKQSRIGVMGRADLSDVFLVDINTENAAFLMQLITDTEGCMCCFSHFIFHSKALFQT